MQLGKLSSWVTFFKGILDISLGEQLETKTESAEQIESLNKTPLWKLKSIVA